MPRLIFMFFNKFILDAQGNPVPERNLLKWAKWYETADRRVKQEWVENVRISTVFTGIDMGWRFIMEGEKMVHIPILWETMTFSNNRELHELMDRCSGNREQAEAMHERMVRKVKEALKAV